MECIRRTLDCKIKLHIPKIKDLPHLSTYPSFKYIIHVFEKKINLGPEIDLLTKNSVFSYPLYKIS